MTPSSEQTLDFDLGTPVADDTTEALASGQRFAIAGVIGYFISAVFEMRAFFAFALLMLASVVCLYIGAVRITRALGYSLPLRVLVLLGLLTPLLNLITLLFVSNRATAALRAQHQHVGLLGAPGGRHFWLMALGMGVLVASLGTVLDRKASSLGMALGRGTPDSVIGVAAQLNRELDVPRVVIPGVRLESADRHEGDLRIRMRLLDFNGNALRPDQRIKMRDVATEKLCGLPAELRTTLKREKARMMYQIENSRGDAIARVLVTLDDCQ